ncbi:MAG: TerD family protein [Capsulimonas sp.]|uniref:TerD family protein n=1 Tax=Capsulimonas sp. TaxID=2494211 RepID=UPI003264B33B
MNNSIYLRRRGKICLDAPLGDGLLPSNVIAAMSKNLEALGYGLSERLIEALRALSLDQLTQLYQELIADLRKSKGADHKFKPMYPNFPTQVMEMSAGELYLNAIVHYWSRGRLLPLSEIKERFPLLDNVELQMIDLGEVGEFELLFTQIAGSNTSLSQQDKEDLSWFVESYGNRIGALLPDAVPQKENAAYLCGLLIRHTSNALEFVEKYARTATDVLRIAVAMSGGDVSLADATKFIVFSRPQRRMLLALLDRQANATEDMLRWKGRWIRLGERLHAGEFRARYPKAAASFDVLRNDLPFATFNGQVERALANKDVDAALRRLETRPGDLARRLDHLLRLGKSSEEVVTAFGASAAQISTPVLLQVRNHFQHRHVRDKMRVFFPKGNLAKVQGVENTLPDLREEICKAIADICSETLRARFATLPTLGKCYVDPTLKNYVVPFSQRSASKALRTVTRGSRMPLPASEALRFFVWWKNGSDRTDIDLSAAMFDEQFHLSETVSYYNLAALGGCHSGDIVDAPKGASEFIDITPSKLIEQGAAFVVMVLMSYTQQPFVDLPECFAGWMARTHPDSGEIFEAKTVQDRLDVTADTQCAIPIVIDLLNDQVIWCDIALKSHPRWQVNVAENLSGIQLTLKSLVEMTKPNLYDLLMLHAQARGETVEREQDAETVFSVANGTPFALETIASEYLK